jgi:Transcription termination factor nusG.
MNKYVYVLQVMTMEEEFILERLKHYNIKTIFPLKMMARTIGKNKSLQYYLEPLISGYIFVYLSLPQDYLILNLPCFKGKIIRICGNGHEAVPLTEDEVTFIKWCDTNLKDVLKLRYDSKNILKLAELREIKINITGHRFKKKQVCIEFKLCNQIHKVWIAYTLQGIGDSGNICGVHDDENVMISA